MKRIALTFLLLAATLCSVFAGITSVNIVSPNGGEVIRGDFNIVFTVSGFTSIGNIDLGTTDLSLYINDANFFDGNKIECLAPINTNPTCYYEMDSTLLPDKNYIAIVDPNDTTPVSFATDTSDSSFMIDNEAPTISAVFPTQGGWINTDINFVRATITDTGSGVNVSSITADFNGTDYNTDNRVIFSSGTMDFNMIGLGAENKTNYTIVIDAQDNAGNNRTFNYSIWIDTNAPWLVSVNVPTLTNDTTPEIITSVIEQESGKNKLMLSCNGTSWTSVAYTSNYSAFDISSCVPGDGDKNVYVKVSDGVGNESNTIIKTITLDTTPPSINMTKTPDTNSWTHSIVIVDLNCLDINGKIKYWLNNNYFFVDSNFANFSVSEDRNNKLTFSCFDTLSNSDGNHISYIAIDKTTPSKASFDLAKAQKDFNVIINWNDVNFVSPLQYFVFRKESSETDFNIIAGPLSDSNYTDNSTSADKNYCYFVRTINSTGADSNSDTKCTMIDQNAPVMLSLSASVTTDDVTISFTSTDTNGSGIKGYYVSRDKNTWYYTTGNSYTFNNLSNGTYTFYVKAVDFADNNSKDKNVEATVNVTSSGGTGGGNTGGSSSSSAGRPTTITTDTNKNIIPIIEELPERVILPETIESRVTSETNDINTGATENNAISPATGAFSLMDIIKASTFPVLLLLLLFLILLIILAGKKKKSDSQAGHGRYFVENDSPDFEVKYDTGIWEYKQKKP